MSIPGAVVLRNHDIWTNFALGGDLDIGVPDLDAAESKLITVLGPPLVLARRSLVRSYIYLWGKVDLLGPIEWRGAVFLHHEELRRGSGVSELGYPKPRLAHEALMSWFLSLLWGGFFKARYKPVIAEAVHEDSEEFYRVLRRAVGRRWASRLFHAVERGVPEESVSCVKPLRRALRFRALARAPRETCVGWARFWLAELRLRLSPPLPWVGVLGPDGAGKTSVLHRLGDSWPKFLGEVRIRHWRPHYIDGWRGGSDGKVEDPHGGSPRGAVLSMVKLGWLLLDWTFGYWMQLANERARQRLVVFDRHFVDLLVDPRRYRFGGRPWMAALVNRLVPRPDVIVVLDAPTPVIQSRKQEVSLAETVRQREEYRRLALRLPDCHVLDASRPLNEVTAAVQHVILEHMERQARVPLKDGRRRLLRFNSRRARLDAGAHSRS